MSNMSKASYFVIFNFIKSLKLFNSELLLVLCLFTTLAKQACASVQIYHQFAAGSNTLRWANGFHQK